MGIPYQPDLWRDLYVMLGTSSAALIGLLFVVTSLHLEEIVSNRIYRVRARNNALHLLVMLIQAAAILTPQSPVALGIELVALNLCGWCLPLSLIYSAFFNNRLAGKRGGFSIYRGLIYQFAYLLGVVGGVALIKFSKWGLYLVTISYVIFIASVIWNAWTILLGLGLTEQTKNAARNKSRKARV
jgi:hypothetical protein